MRKEIITRIVVWIVTIVIILLGGYAVKEYIIDKPVEPEEPGASYTINAEDFEGIIAYGGTLDLSQIKITKTENGVSTDIPVDISMVTTPVDTTRVGTAVLKLSYEGETFSIPVTVKYKVQFIAGDGIFKTVYTLDSSELDKVEAPQKEGYTFVGWSTDIPDVLYENMHLTATYEAIIPALSTVNATYGDKLADIILPTNAAGAWKLDNAEGTVGDAGKRTFDVSFVENGTNEVLKTAKLTVNVAKRAVKIDVFADYIYNGTRQEPTYKIDVEGLKVSAWLDGDKNYTDAGEYSYHYEIDDANYVGEAKGTYVIKPAVVTVKINDYSIFANEAFPKAEYQISGFDGMTQEELSEFIGLTLVYPESVVVGEHKITATCSNPSIQLTVEGGTLKVIQATLGDIGVPKTPDGSAWTATYEDLLSSVEFAEHPNGKWVWKTPDATVGTVGKQTHTAIFIPSNSAFEPIECDVEITVNTKKMIIEVVGDTTFNYDGNEHKVSFVVKDEEGNVYDTLEVLGNTPYTNANEKGYTVTLTLADPNYSATKVVTLTINKINPVTDFTQIFNDVWSATLKLSDIELPEGYTWDNPDKRIEKAGTAYYAVTFTPADTVNYNKVTGEFKVEVEKATPEIKNVKDSYTHTYNGSVYTIAGVTSSNNGTLVYTYGDGTLFAGVKDAGTYTVVITLLESENYKAVEKQTTITVSPADNEKDSVKVVQSATYGDPITKIELPNSEIGTWYIQGNPTTVGDAGTNTFVAVFEPATGNYNAKSVTITVTVAKKVIRTPAAVNLTSVYDSTTKYSGLEDTDLYTVITDGAIDVGAYEAELELVDADNYAWDYVGNTGKTTKVKYSIVKATITFETKPEIQEEWTFTPGQTIPLPDFGVDQGFVPAEDIYFEYQYSADGGQTWTGWLRWTDATAATTWSLRATTNAPSQAGMYRVRAVVVGTNNYDQIVTTDKDIVEFVIHKAEVVVPGYTKQYPYKGVGNPVVADIPTSNLYSIKYTVGTYVGDVCYATLTLNDSVNYMWVEKEGEEGAYGHSNSIQLNYEIVKANPELSGLTVPNVTFGNKPNPSVSNNNFKVGLTYTYATSEEGPYSTTEPTAVGKYWVKASFGGNDNILAQTIGPVSFEIEKAEATISGANNGATISKNYRGTEGYTLSNLFPNMKGSHNETALTYAVDGQVVDVATFKFVDVKENDGVYTVVITLPESEDYKSATITVYVDINKATVSIATPSINDTNWKYGDDARQPNAIEFNEAFANHYSGAIAFKYYSDANCQNEISAPSNATGAGTYYVRAEFAGNGNINAVTGEAKAFTISKVILTPSIPNKVYNGGYQLSGLNDNRYTVTEVDNGAETPKGGKNVGTYTVTLTLTAEAAKNYAWTGVDNEELDIQVTYTIVKEENLAFNNSIDIEGWTYGQYDAITNAYASVEANKSFANELIKYEYSIDGGNTWNAWSNPADFNAGEYKIRAIIVGTDNYNQVVSEKSFTVAKAPVYITDPEGNDLPETITEFFTNTVFDAPAYKASYGVSVTVTISSEIKNVGTYTITYSFDGTDTNYLSATETITVTIQKATIVISNVGVTPWAYKTQVNTPTATIAQTYAQGKEYFQYSTDGGTTWLNWNDNLDKLLALPAGTYKVRAVVPNDPDGNYTGVTSAAFDFVVNKATTTITGADNNQQLTEKTYRENGYQVTDIVTLGAGHGGKAEFAYTYKMWNTITEKYDIPADGILHAGKYEIVITLKESTNYLSTSITVYLTVNKEVEDDSGIVVDESKLVFGKPVLEAITLPESEHGTWSITGVDATTKFDAVGAQTFTAVFTPDAEHEADYDTKTVTINIVVAQASTSITVNGTYGNKGYDGQFVSIFGATVSNGENDKIVITVNGTEVAVDYQFKNAGEYEIVYTYAGNTNYAGTTKTFTVTISSVTVDIDLTIDDTDWKYGMDAKAPSAVFDPTKAFAAEYNKDITFEYYYDADCKNQIKATADKTLAEVLKSLDAGTYYVKAVFESNGNLNATSAKTSFTIQKATVPVPEYTAEYYFVIGDINVVFPNGTSNLYSISGNVASNGAREYEMTLDLGTNFKNHEWIDAEGNVISKQSIKLGYKVVPSQVELVGLTTGWTYGAYNNTQPTVMVKLLNGNNEVIQEVSVTQIKPAFSYYKDADCTIPFTPDNKTPAGTEYWVKATVGNTTNYYGDTLVAKFTIVKATPTIEGIDLNTVYGKVYDGTAYEFPSTIKGYCADGTVAPAVTYEEIVNYGEYTVSITLPESDNYESVTVEGVRVKINKATNTETITVGNTSNFVYNAPILSDSTIKLPAGVQGTWELRVGAIDGTKVAADAKFDRLGDFTFWAVFTPDQTGNYEVRTVEITVEVDKAPVKTPAIGNITYIEGQHQKPNLEDTNDYWVRENEGGENAGSYTVKLELKNPDYYKWNTTVNVSGSKSEFITVTYKISAAAQNWAVEPVITPVWQYQLSENYEYPYGYAQAEHRLEGDDTGVDIFYTLYNDGNYTFTYSDAEKVRPTTPGKYVARFRTNNPNYDILVYEEDKPFEITAREITPPEWNNPEFPYRGGNTNITSGLEDGFGYQIISDEGGIVVGNYSATAKLTDEYYIWADTKSGAERTFDYSIVETQIIISGLGVNGWVYDPNKTTVTPSYTLSNVHDNDKAGVTVTFKYYKQDGTYLGDGVIPTTAGWYYVVATATPVDNDNLLTSVETKSANFQITPAPTYITGATDGETFTQIANNQEFTASYKPGGYSVIANGINGIITLGAAHDETAVFEIEVDGILNGTINDKGTYSVKITLIATDNYQEATVTIVVEVEPAEVPFDESLKNQTITFGNSIELPDVDPAIGYWSLTQSYTQAGGNQTFKAIFTSVNGNYASNTEGVTITVSIDRAPITFEGNEDASAPYTNGRFTAPTVTALSQITGVNTGMGYDTTITAITGDTTKWSVGTYTVTYTFAGNANYEGGSTSLTFTITPATITLGAPGITAWNYKGYDANNNAASVEVLMNGEALSNFNNIDIPVVFYYYKKSDNTPITNTNETDWQDKLNALNVDTYYVVAKVSATGNYGEATSVAKEFTLEKAPITLSGVDATYPKTYDGEVYNKTAFENAICNANKAYGLSFTYSPDGDIINKGEYNVTITLDEETAKNYVLTSSVTTKIVIEQAEVELENLVINNNIEANINWTFGEAMQVPSITTQAFAQGKVYYQYQYKNPTTGEWSEWITWKTSQEISANAIATVNDVPEGIPTNAGTYRLRAVVDNDASGNNNYVGATTTPDNPGEDYDGYFTFTIKKAPVTIVPGISNTEKDYDGVAIEIPAPLAQNSAGNELVGFTVTLIITDKNDGTTVATLTPDANGNWPEYHIIDVGEYTLTYTVDVGDNTNFTSEGATKTVTIIIKEATVSVVTPTIDNWTYAPNHVNDKEPNATATTNTGINLTTKIEFWYLAEGESEWSKTVPANAGTHKVKAVVPADSNGNYARGESTAVEFVIAKDVIDEPADFTLVYNGAFQLSGLDDTLNRYTVTEDNNGQGGKIVGSYTVTLTLSDDAFKNYAWNDVGNESKTVEVTYTIIKEENLQFTNSMNITGWTYGLYNATTNAHTVITANKTFANELIKYQYATWDSENEKWSDWTEWTNPAGFGAGKYKIRAIIVGTENHNQVVSNEKEFEVKKATTASITANSTYSEVYRGSAYTVADLFASVTASQGTTQFTHDKLTYTYAGTTNEFTGITDFGSVTVVITLPASDNYETVSVEVTVSVTQATVTLANLSAGWTYNSFQAPTVTVKLGEEIVTNIPVVFYYYKSSACTESDLITTSATEGYTTILNNRGYGTSYYVKAVVAETSNYSDAEAGVTFTIARAGASIDNVTGTDRNNPITKTYRSTGGYTLAELLPGLTASHTEEATWSYSITGIGNVAKENIASVINNVKTTGDGVYELVISLGESANYTGATVNVYVKILPIDGPTLDQTEYNNVEFGSKLLETIGTLPDGWSIQGVDGNTLVGNVGPNKFTVKYSNGSNYKERTETITINVIAKSVTIDGVTSDDTFTAPYKGTAYTSADIAAVIKNAGKTIVVKDGTSTLELGLSFTLSKTAQNVDDYQVVISLNETNYTAQSVTVTFKIEKATVTFGEFTGIGNWTYHPTNANAKTPAITATVGAATVPVGEITFKYSTDPNAADGDWTTAVPTTVGTYYVKAVVNTDNYAGATDGKKSFQITVATVTKPTFTVDSEGYVNFTYNDDVQKPTIDASDYYTITWLNANSEDFGTYKVTLTLKNPTGESYITWNDASTAAYEINYRINKANASVTITSPSNGSTVIYKGSAYEATATVTPNTFSATFAYYKHGGKNEQNEDIWTLLTNGAKPTDVGYYKIVATVAGNNNVNGCTIETTFTITAATLTLDRSAYDSKYNGRVYQNRLELMYEQLKATFNGSAVAGAFTYTYSDPVYNTETGVFDVSGTITFRPTSSNYEELSQEFSTVFVPVAKIGDTYYATIEKALSVATSGQTVVVLPFDAKLGAVYLKSLTGGSVEIKTGVKLVLPYADANGTMGQNTYDDRGVANVVMHYGVCGAENSGHITSTNITDDAVFCNSYCFVKVIVAKDVTILNNGTLEISGQISGGAGDNKFAGYTAGLHARLYLEEGAIIHSASGSIIRAAGYIRNLDEAKGGNILIDSGATLYQPFVMMDYYSGQYLAGPYKTLLDGKGNPVNPFNKFTMINVSPEVRVNYGGTVIGWAALYTTSTDGNNTAPVTYVGSGGVIELLSGSYLTAKLNPALNSLVTKVDVYGGAKTNPIKLTIELHEYLSPLTVTTEACWFPLTYLNDITLHSGNYTIGQNFKMMPGAKLTVEADATLDITGKFIVYDQDTISSPAPEFSYYDDQRPNHPASGNVKYGVTEPAVFTVNGALTAATLGGKVHTSTEGAKITITKATSLEAHEAKTYKDGDLKGLGYSDIITGIAASMGIGGTKEVDQRIYIKKNAVLVGEGDIPATQATLGTWVAKSIVLDDYNGLNTDPIEGLTFVQETGTAEYKYAALPYPIKDGFVFKGWFIGDTQVKNGDAFPSTTPTLTAHWTAGATVTLDYNDGETADDHLSYEFAAGTGSSQKYVGLDAYVPTRPGYEFGGWCYENTETLITKDSNLVIDTNHTLKAKWIPKTYTITFNWVFTGFDEDPTIDGLQVSITYHPDMANVTLPIPEVEYGFNGFFTARQTDGTFATADKIYSGISGAELLRIAKGINGTANNETVGNITVYGNWVPKVYVFVFDFSQSNPYGLTAPEAIGSIAGYNPLADTKIHSMVTANDGVSTTNEWYFVGWYTDSALTVPYAPDDKIGDDVQVITLYAKWNKKAKVTFDYGTNDPNKFADPTPIWVKPGTQINITDTNYLSQNVNAKDNDVNVQQYFTGWSISGNGTLSGTTATFNGDVTVAATWGTKHKITISNNGSNVTSFSVTVTGYSAISAAGDYWFKPGSSVTITATATAKGAWHGGGEVINVKIGTETKHNHQGLRPDKSLSLSVSNVALVDSGSITVTFANNYG